MLEAMFLELSSGTDPVDLNSSFKNSNPYLNKIGESHISRLVFWSLGKKVNIVNV